MHPLHYSLLFTTKITRWYERNALFCIKTLHFHIPDSSLLYNHCVGEFRKCVHNLKHETRFRISQRCISDNRHTRAAFSNTSVLPVLNKQTGAYFTGTRSYVVFTSSCGIIFVLRCLLKYSLYI